MILKTERKPKFTIYKKRYLMAVKRTQKIPIHNRLSTFLRLWLTGYKRLPSWYNFQNFCINCHIKMS